MTSIGTRLRWRGLAVESVPEDHLHRLNFSKHGVEIRKQLLAQRDIRFVAADISLESDILRSGGIRNLEKKFASIARLAGDPMLLGIANDLLGGPSKLVRVLFFDKTPERNWAVAWHQDKTVTLNKKIDMEGWGPWSVKEGVCHVQPPCAVLDRMLTVRLHVDPTDETNGCLRVIPGSHRSGILKQEEIDRWVKSHRVVSCAVSAGDAVVLKPHVLHSSRRTLSRAHRRVVHLDYSDYELPEGVCWA